LSKPFSPLILPTGDITGLQSSLLTVIDALNAATPRLGLVEDILEAAGLATTRFGAAPMTWLGVWTAAFVYLRGDVVTHGSLLVVANKTTTSTPSIAAPDWDVLTSGGGGGGGVLSTVKALQLVTPTFLDTTVRVLHFDGSAHDTNNLHDPIVNNDRLVADVDGYWECTGQWESVDNDLQFQGTDIVQITPTDSFIISRNRMKYATSVLSVVTINTSSGSFWMDAGDYIIMRAQAFPSTDTRVNENVTFFTLSRVRD